MKSKMFFLILLVVLVWSIGAVAQAEYPALAAQATSGTASVSMVSQLQDGSKQVVLLRRQVKGTADSSGNFVSPLIDIKGRVLRFQTIPSTDVATSCAANYDVTLLDGYGADLLRGKGANRSSTAVEAFVPTVSDVDGQTTVPLGYCGTAQVKAINQLAGAKFVVEWVEVRP